MDDQQAFDFLDILTIFSVALQVDQAIGLQKQATNNDLLKELRNNVALLNSKLDRLLRLAEGNNKDADKHPSNARSTSQFANNR